MIAILARRVCFCLVIVSSSGVATASFGQTLASDSPATQQLYKALAEPAEIVSEQVPFREIVNQLRQRHRIEIQVDNASVAAAGVTAVTPVTRQIRGVSLESALDLLLRDLNLEYVIKDEVVLIVSREAAAHMLETRVYDVSDLLSEPVDAANLVGAVALVVPHPQSTGKAPQQPPASPPAVNSSSGTPPPSTTGQQPPPAPSTPMTAEHALAGATGAQVVVIASPAERDVVLFHGSLAVRTTPRAQRDVQRFLARFRDANSFPKRGETTFEPRPIRR